MRFVSRLDVRCNRMRGVKDEIKAFVPEQCRRIELPCTEVIKPERGKTVVFKTFKFGIIRFIEKLQR